MAALRRMGPSFRTSGPAPIPNFCSRPAAAVSFRYSDDRCEYNFGQRKCCLASVA